MMNALALGLVLTSLVTAGFFTPEKPKSEEDVIVKEGRRVVVVEYEKDVGNTKVSISPQVSHQSVVEDVKEGARDFAAKSREMIEDVKEAVEGGVEEIHPRFRPRELVCDAYGKCKHKIASIIGKTTVEEENGAIGKVKVSAHRAKESVEDSARKAKEKVSEKAGGIKEEASRRMEGAKEVVSEKAGGINEEASRIMEGAKEKVSEKARGVKEEASRMMEGAKESVSEKASEVKEEASRMMEGAKESVSEKASEVKEEASRRAEGAKEVEEGGEKKLGEIMHRARDVLAEVFNYSAEAVGPVTGVLHLMGFAAAYGMCLWVTFGSSHVLAVALPRQQFAVVQSRIYPLYFKAMGCSVGMALLGHLMSPRKILGARVGMFRGFDLVTALALILVNLWYLEPRATKVMHEKMKMEKEEGMRKEVNETGGRGSVGKDEAKTERMIELSRTLQRLNSYSSFINVMTLVSLTWHLLRLAQRLHVVC